MADEAGPSTVVKHKHGKLLRSGEKCVILNVFNSLIKQHPTQTVIYVMKVTSETCGVSKHSVRNMRKERKGTGAVKSPILITSSVRRTKCG